MDELKPIIVKTKYQDTTFYLGLSQVDEEKVELLNSYICSMAQVQGKNILLAHLVTPKKSNIPKLVLSWNDIVIIDDNDGKGYTEFYDRCRAEESGISTSNLLLGR